MSLLNIHLHPEVEAALSAKQPVVALESTLITHGFPRPDNLDIATAIEQTVREHGAVPATIAILDGQITVGLTNQQLEQLADLEQARKCSVRDLPITISKREYGATTVAATMIIAHRVGIQVFATGGIGGIHRRNPGRLDTTAADGWDVSADLRELGRTPITVVCAGMKAFLDLPATLEYLETQAVPVLGYGVKELPAFYSHKSGLALDSQVDSPQEVAQIIQIRNELGLKNAILVTVPVPTDQEWPAQEAGVVIELALAEAQTMAITGKAVTPFLLDRIVNLSAGRSKQANTSLLLNNARLGAQIAAAHQSIE